MIEEPPTSDEAMQLASARRLKMLLARRDTITKSNGLALYKPHAKQDAFHRAGQYPRRYVRSGNRFGKSLMGAAEDCAWALGERVWYPKNDLARTVGIPSRPTVGCIVVQDWDKSDEIFTSQVEGQGKGKLFKLLPDSAIDAVIKNQAGNICEIRVKSIHGGVSTIRLDTIKSFKANPMGFESSDWDWIHIDEPCPEEMWKAMSRGLVDRNGSAWFTCTPIIEMWINDMFIPKKLMRSTFTAPVVSESKLFWTITGSMHDNPTLTTEAKQLYISTLKPDEAAARIDGRPRALAGQIYKDFDPLTHDYDFTPYGWEDHNLPPHNWTIRLGIDTHGSTNSNQAVLFVATGPQGHSYFFAEIFEAMLIPDICEMIYEKLQGRAVYQAVLEPGAYIQHPTRGDSMADDFLNAGLPVEPATKDLGRGILRAQEMLNLRDPKTAEPMLRFSPHLTEFHFEIDRYVWDQKGKPVDKDDHMMENFYRLCLTGLEYVKPDDYVARTRPAMSIKSVNLSLPAISLDLPGSLRERKRSYKPVRYRS